MALLRGAFAQFQEDDALTLGAALAFYAILSLAPLLVILIWVGTLLSSRAQETLSREIISLIGAEAGEGIRSIIEHSGRHPVLGSVSGIGSFIMLVIGAIGAFGQLQHSINRIWDLQLVAHREVRNWIRRTLLSIGMILFLGILLPASVGVTAALSWLFGKWIVIDVAVSLMVFTLLFALVFKYLPDARIAWRDAWAGGFFTGLLFVAGKFAIGLYLGRSVIVSAYGAAGTLIVLLLWIYYSALIFFFGAELTQIWAKASGRAIMPSGYAVRLE